MGCTCAYENQNRLGFVNPFDEENVNTLDNCNISQKELTRNTSISRLSSQRSVMLSNFNKKIEYNAQPMKIDKIGFADQILEEYNIARKNSKFYAFKIKTFQEKIIKDKKDETAFYFRNSSGTKIVLRNADVLCNQIIKQLESIKHPLKPLEKNELFVATAKKALNNIKQTKVEREEQLKTLYNNIISPGFNKNALLTSIDENNNQTNKKSNNNNKIFGSIFGFGDYDPSLVVMLQLIDGKDNNYASRCILNPDFTQCGVSVVESDKLKILAISHFFN